MSQIRNKKRRAPEPPVSVFSEPEEKGSAEFFPDQAGNYHSPKDNHMEWIIAGIIVLVLFVIWLIS